LPEARAAISGRAVADRGAQQRRALMMQLATIDIFAAGEEWGRLRRPGVVEMIDKRLSRLSDASATKSTSTATASPPVIS
jgi:glutathione S-transferase